jgi:hypothetical protein
VYHFSGVVIKEELKERGRERNKHYKEEIKNRKKGF